MQRRIDAKDASKAQPQAQAQPEADQQSSTGEHISSTPPAEPPLSKDSYYSVIDSGDLPSDSSLDTSSSAGDLASSQSAASVQALSSPTHQSAGISDSELSKLAGLKSEAQQAQHAQQSAGSQPAAAAGASPVSILAKAGSGKAADAAPAEGKQRRKSKREKARGLLSSFTSSRKQLDAQQDMDQALLMLAELRRTESTPNVEAEALKRNKGGGGPWMSFTRQRRPPKPRPAKKGSGSPGGARRGSPLSTVISGESDSSSDLTACAYDGYYTQERRHKGMNDPPCACMLICSQRHSSCTRPMELHSVGTLHPYIISW